MNKLSKWFYDNTPMIMRRKTYHEDIAKLANRLYETQQDIFSLYLQLSILPILDELKELRNNTWDLERLERIYGLLEYLKVSQSENQDD